MFFFVFSRRTRVHPPSSSGRTIGDVMRRRQRLYLFVTVDNGNKSRNARLGGGKKMTSNCRGSLYAGGAKKKRKRFFIFLVNGTDAVWHASHETRVHPLADCSTPKHDVHTFNNWDLGIVSGPK